MSHHNVHAPATNPLPPPVSERQHPDVAAGKYSHPTEIDCPACKAAKAQSLGFVEFTNKGGNTVIANYECKACGVTSEVQLVAQ